MLFITATLILCSSFVRAGALLHAEGSGAARLRQERHAHRPRVGAGPEMGQRAHRDRKLEPEGRHDSPSENE